MADSAAQARYAGKVAVVTGGASGIGLGITQRLLAEHASVVVGDRSPAGLAELQAEVGSRLASVKVDVTQEDEVEKLIQTAVDRFGAVDVAFNAAGWADGAPIVEQTNETWNLVLGICLTGVFFALKHEARQMITQGNGGAIINIRSVSGLVPARGASAYTVAKAGVDMLTKNAALELGEQHIRVNAIGPGLVETPMAWRTGNMEPGRQGLWVEHTPMGRIGRPDDIASAALFLASDEATWISGVTLYVDGGSILTACPDFRRLDADPASRTSKASLE